MIHNKFKQSIKRMILRKRGINLDKMSTLNRTIKTSENFHSATIIDSKLEISQIGDGCFIEHATFYGDIRLGRNVSVSGPGTIFHAVNGYISIGSFSSIAENVSIQEFNHNMDLPTTFAMQLNYFSGSFLDDSISKGNVILEEDVWVCSNAVILSGVRIGRGAVIAAGAVVTKDVPRYAVVGGNPARLIKMRFTESQIELLEESRWWTWDDNKILNNRSFFENRVGEVNEFR